MKARGSSLREKSLIVVMLGVVSTFLLQRFVLAPYRVHLDDLKTATVRKERQLRRTQTLLASRTEIEAEYKRRFGDSAGPRPRQAPGEMGNFLKSIEKVARKLNVKIRDIRPRTIEDRNQNTTLSASFVTESSQGALSRFLLALRDQRVIVEKMTLTRSTQSKKGIKAQIQLILEPH